jgi:outer membrane receptor protein involved in Fe transport
VSLSGRYVGESFQEPTNNALFIMPSFFVADAGLTVNLWGTSRLEVFVNNIFDEQYFTFGAPVDLDFDGGFDEPGYFVQPPRNFYTKLIIAF